MPEPVGIARLIVPLHILAGFVALLSGYLALGAAKGARLHRKSGLVFVSAMAVMALTGALIAYWNASTSSLIAGLLTFYFVTTALRTVRRGPAADYRLDIAGMLFAMAVALVALRAGIDGLQRGRPEGIPMLIFCSMGLVAAAGDARMIRAGGISGRPRITRHLWRMCFGMWVAAASFFWGPPARVPELIRYPAFYPIPVLAPVAVMLYWLWRLRRDGPAASSLSAYPQR